METVKGLTKTLIEQVGNYSKTTLEITKLKTLYTSSHVATSLISRLSVIIMVSLFALILNIGIALYLGEKLGKNYYGFFIVSAFYLLAALILHFFLAHWIKKPISDLIITQALK
jgi:ABC-type dipeptide/oligopeptide/nickel transport system permease component